MNFKKSIVITVIFLLVAGFYYFYEIVGKPKREEKKKKDTSVITIEDVDVKTLDLHRNFGKDKKEEKPGEKKGTPLKPSDISFEKKDKLWMITKPIQTKAEQNVAIPLIAGITGIKKEEVVEENPEDIKKYGLEPPMFSTTVSDGKKSETVLLGSQTVDKKHFYAQKKGEKEVFLTNAGFKHNLEKFLTGYRDKKIFDIKIEDVGKLAVSYEGNTYIFSRKGDKWAVEAPPFPRADSQFIKNYVQSVLNLQTSEFFDNNEKNRQNQRLDNAQDYIEIYLKDEKHPVVLRLSTPKTSEKFLYSMVDGRDELYGLQKGYYNSMSVKPERLFKKKLFTFDASKLKTLSINMDGKKAEMTKEEVNDKKEDDKKKLKNLKWVITSPQKKDVDSKQVGRLVNNIRNFYVKDAVFAKDKLKETGLDNPSTVITGKDAEGKDVFVLRIGKMTGDKLFYYVMVDDEDTIETMQKPAIEGLKKHIESIVFNKK